jgi:hypothetical protein
MIVYIFYVNKIIYLSQKERFDLYHFKMIYITHIGPLDV